MRTDTGVSQGVPEIGVQPPGARMRQGRIFLQVSGGASPCRHLAFRLVASRLGDNTSLLSYTTQCMAPCLAALGSWYNDPHNWLDTAWRTSCTFIASAPMLPPCYTFLSPLTSPTYTHKARCPRDGSVDGEIHHSNCRSPDSVCPWEAPMGEKGPRRSRQLFLARCVKEALKTSKWSPWKQNAVLPSTENFRSEKGTRVLVGTWFCTMGWVMPSYVWGSFGSMLSNPLPSPAREPSLVLLPPSPHLQPPLFPTKAQDVRDGQSRTFLPLNQCLNPLMRGFWNRSVPIHTASTYFLWD